MLGLSSIQWAVLIGFILIIVSIVLISNKRKEAKKEKKKVNYLAEILLMGLGTFFLVWGYRVWKHKQPRPVIYTYTKQDDYFSEPDMSTETAARAKYEYLMNTGRL